MNNNSMFVFSVSRKNNTIRVKKEFAAGISLVWDAYTKSEILDKWWGPKPWKAITKSMDFREGGQWLYVMMGPKGEEFWSKSNFLNIQPKKKFTGLDAFTDAEGNVTNEFPQSKWEVTFHDKGQTTLVEILISYEDPAQLEATLQMGFKEGLRIAMEGLDEVLASENKADK